jgi:hypothetical protein
LVGDEVECVLAFDVSTRAVFAMAHVSQHSDDCLCTCGCELWRENPALLARGGTDVRDFTDALEDPLELESCVVCEGDAMRVRAVGFVMPSINAMVGWKEELGPPSGSGALGHSGRRCATPTKIAVWSCSLRAPWFHDTLGIGGAGAVRRWRAMTT